MNPFHYEDESGRHWESNPDFRDTGAASSPFDDDGVAELLARPNRRRGVLVELHATPAPIQVALEPIEPRPGAGAAEARARTVNVPRRLVIRSAANRATHDVSLRE